MEDINNQPIKSKRDELLAKMKGRYPDKDFADDDSFFAQINEDYDDYDKAKGHEKAFIDMFSSDPRSAAFLTSWRNGSDPVVELVRQFGTDIKDAIDDPTRLDQIAAANKEYLDRVAKDKGLEEDYQKNLAQSLQDIEAFQAQRGMSDKQVDALMESVIQIVQDGIQGKFSPQTLLMVQKAMSHDADVDMAGQEGEIRGRNQRIEERLRHRDEGDGTARLDGKNAVAADSAPRRKNIFDLAREAK